MWRLSTARHVRAFDGGYGLLYDGRWNTAGQAVTYCATSPSLCVLEKLVHIQDPALVPALMMVRYDVPDGCGVETIDVGDLPAGWRLQENWTQRRGGQWYASSGTLLLFVPSAIVPVEGSPDMNVLVNHRHPAAASVRMVGAEPFVLDVRLF